MSDYISIQEVIDRLSEVLSSEEEFEKAKQVIIEAPTLDEKEIIRKPFERIVERLEEEARNYKDGVLQKLYFETGVARSILVVKEEGGIE